MLRPLAAGRPPRPSGRRHPKPGWSSVPAPSRARRSIQRSPDPRRRGPVHGPRRCRVASTVPGIGIIACTAGGGRRRVVPRLRARLERLGAVAGHAFTASTTGTNSIATAFELGRGLAVSGGEHHLGDCTPFTCNGVPIVDPVTRREQGVLDTTCLGEDAQIARWPPPATATAWSATSPRAWRMAAGSPPAAAAPLAPFGGVKAHGFGRELGPEGLANHQYQQSVYCRSWLGPAYGRSTPPTVGRPPVAMRCSHSCSSAASTAVSGWG